MQLACYLNVPYTSILSSCKLSLISRVFNMKLKYLSCSFKGERVSCEMEEFSAFKASQEPKQHLDQLCLN